MKSDAEVEAGLLTDRQREVWLRYKEGTATEKDKEYVAKWRNNGVGARPAPPPTYGCVYRSALPTREKVDCATCHLRTGANGLDVYVCSHPELSGKCTISDRPISTGDNPVDFCQECEYRTLTTPLLQLNLPPSSLPVQMVMPADRRPHIYRGGILQIWITNACDRACFGCTQCSNLAGKPRFMSVEQFRAAVESLRDYFGVVGIFGGNPCLHPQFDEICSVLRGVIPWEQRGLWSNHPKGKGKTARITFNPKFSNLNVHQSQEAHDEFSRDWPECRPYLKGLDSDSRHSPPFVALKDVIPDEAERWKLISNCDINKNWSALIGVFRNQLRGYFCELAASQSMLHQEEPDYPDTGMPVTPGWWKQGQKAFDKQINKHCHECGIPLRGYGALANDGPAEQVSETHQAVYRLKRPDRKIERVTELIQLGNPLGRMTDYLENSSV
jgi:hypothetical protein